MGLRSIYGSGPDEQEIFRLTDPNAHPSTDDSTIAQEDINRLATTEYDDEQAQFDEQAEFEDLISRIDNLSPLQLSELLNYLQQER